MRLVRFAVELRMELARDEERMLGQLDDLDQLAVRREPGEGEIGFLKTFAVGVVKFVTVAMPLVDDESTIQACRFGA